MIRPYKPEDTDPLIDVWYAASLVAHPFLSAEVMAQEKLNIRNNYLPKIETWILEEDSRLCGFLSLIENEVGAIFVHPAHQGKGFGKALMDKAVALRGSLFLDVFKENSIGRAFYDRYGFRTAREHIHEQTGNALLQMEFG